MMSDVIVETSAERQPKGVCAHCGSTRRALCTPVHATEQHLCERSKFPMWHLNVRPEQIPNGTGSCPRDYSVRLRNRAGMISADFSYVSKPAPRVVGN